MKNEVLCVASDENPFLSGPTVMHRRSRITLRTVGVDYHVSEMTTLGDILRVITEYPSQETTVQVSETITTAWRVNRR